MIALADGLPLLRFQAGEVARFRRDWLVSSIRRAAEGAGYREWWLAEHVTDSITTYLQLCCDENTVTVAQLEKAVRDVLQVIGYAEVGARFVPDPPIAQIHLPALAQESGPGCFLNFYHHLAEHLRRVQTIPRQQIEIEGLHHAIKLLLCRKNWSKSCWVLQREIVGFIRGTLDRGTCAGELRLTIS